MSLRNNNLAKYRKKRNFNKTPEPEGIIASKKGNHYLIQKHAASRLHYDFRLELDGVLKSWAVTKGPSLNPNIKRLAVEVEDHPVSYGSFEGIIPKGQYGGGTVMLWDQGAWEPIGDPHEGLRKGKLVFQLHGKRLHGEWTLVRMRADKEKQLHNNWLLIKHRDESADEDESDELLADNTTSITSGRTMEEIAADKDRIWESKGKSVSISEVYQVKPKKTVKMPGFIKPELATLSDVIPEGKEWLHEIKFDGYRAISYINNGKIRIFTRSGLDWTEKFKSIANALKKIAADTAILDGEIIALNNEGVSSFKVLQDILEINRSNQLQYYVFDLLYLDGESLLNLPLIERKARLETLINKDPTGRIIFSEHFTLTKDFLQRVCAMQLEGIVSKRIDAPYRSGRDRAWLKIKCHKRQEFVIGGFTEPTHKARGIGALLLGYYEEEELKYAGKVGTGFNHALSHQLRKKLEKLRKAKQPFEQVPTDGRRGAIWVKPELVCEVEFTEWTTDGRLRHPSFQGLRQDKAARFIVRDDIDAKKKKPEDKASSVMVGGIRISHPERVIYPGTKISKQVLAEYYLAVSNKMLPYIINRPISMIRCPEGIGKECFFQRHISSGQSPFLHDAVIDVKGHHETYLMIKDLQGLLALIQFGVIELHNWGCKTSRPDKPDTIVFDLDPDPEVPFKKVIEGAKEIRERMREFGLKSFVKTTGGKGVHVVIPLVSEYSWPTIKVFARAIAQSMQHDKPESYIATSSKAARKGKIFVDYLRNDLTSTAIAPYSARARAGAPVAMPISWKELDTSLKPAKFTIENAAKRLKNMKVDPWGDYSKLKQRLPAKYLKALEIDH